MKQYKDLILKLLAKTNVHRKDRTGTGTVGIFGHQMRFDLRTEFPLVSIKKTFTRGMVAELLWMLSGSTNNKVLTDQDVHIWDDWATEMGSLGPIYGAQWRSWLVDFTTNETLDQIALLMTGLKEDPYSRRHVVTAWNPTELPDPKLTPQENAKRNLMALAPCHCLFQFYVEDLSIDERVEWLEYEAKIDLRDAMRQAYGPLYDDDNLEDVAKVLDMNEVPDKSLSCQLYQRSCDTFLGLPFNIASYALLTHMIAHQLNYDVGDFIWTGGDTHLYLNHLDQASEMVTREPRGGVKLKIKRKPDDLFSYTVDDFEFEGYDPHPAIKGVVSV